MKALLITLAIFLVAALPSTSLNAAEDQEPLMYYQIDPNILTFYQNTGKKLGYIVVQIQVVVRGQDHYDLVEEHLPLIQDALIDFFNRLTEEVIKDLTQRDALREQSKTRLNEVLKEETGQEIVKDILFTQYVYQ
ncbi:flagellar basal body-associated FliL family protein [Aliikangiella sp. IMCC44653]